jgi:hypothetical protein
MSPSAFSFGALSLRLCALPGISADVDGVSSAGSVHHHTLRQKFSALPLFSAAQALCEDIYPI